MFLNQNRQGELFIFSEAAFWGLFPVMTVLSLNTVSPLLALAISTFFSALVFALFLTIKGKWSGILNRKAYKDILLATFFIGILFYIFYFFGLKFTSPGNASIIALSEVFFSYMFFQIWRKDPMPVVHIMGAILMLSGAIIVLVPNFSKFHPGDILILLAALIAPVGNFFAKRAREKASSETIMFIRSAIAAPVIFILALTFEKSFSFSSLRSSMWFLILNGFFLLGLSKIFWLEGIHRIGVTKANALSSISPLLTLLFAWLILHNLPSVWQLLALAPMAIGTFLLALNKQEIQT